MRLLKLGRGTNGHKVDTINGTVYFSYQTPVAFFSLGFGYVERENDWGPTTGGHLRAARYDANSAAVTCLPGTLFVAILADWERGKTIDAKRILRTRKKIERDEKRAAKARDARIAEFNAAPVVRASLAERIRSGETEWTPETASGTEANPLDCSPPVVHSCSDHPADFCEGCDAAAKEPTT